jgi:hypothetical protein
MPENHGRQHLSPVGIYRLRDLQEISATLRPEMPDTHPVRVAVEEYAALLAGYADQGLSGAYLGSVIPVSRTAIKRRIASHRQRAAAAEDAAGRSEPPGSPSPGRRRTRHKVHVQDGERRRIQQLYDAGELTVGAIAAMFGVTRGTVYASLTPGSTGGRPTSNRTRPRDVRRLLRPDEIERLRELRTISATLRPEMPAGHPVRVAAGEYVALLANLVEEGFSTTHLASTVSVSRAAIERRLASAGYRPIPPSVASRVATGQQR